jgi:hypothetical protein
MMILSVESSEKHVSQLKPS